MHSHLSGGRGHATHAGMFRIDFLAFYTNGEQSRNNDSAK